MRDLGGEGDGVVEDESGKVWFVRGAVPGDRVSFRPTRKRQSRGQLVTVDSPSDDRVVASCAHVRDCGGCPTMVWNGDAERRWKLGRVAKALNVDVDRITWVPSPAAEYRCRIRLAFDNRRLGYRAPRSARLVDVTRCPIADRPLQTALELCRAHLLEMLEGSGELVLATGRDRRPVALLKTESTLAPEVFRTVERLVDDRTFAGVELLAGGASVGATFGDPQPHLPSFDGVPLVLPSGGFSQANATIAVELQKLVHAWAEPKGRTVLELYAGAGLLTVAIGADAHSLTSLESDPSAVACARRNLEERGIAATTLIGDAACPPDQTFDAVILDPPREGAIDALRSLSRHWPPVLVYVSCHVGSLGRDAAYLASEGFEVDRVAALDMFPQTAHVETAVRFVRGTRPTR